MGTTTTGERLPWYDDISPWRQVELHEPGTPRCFARAAGPPAGRGSAGGLWATRALEIGVETESLILLAGLPADCSVYEAGPLLERGLTDLNLTVPSPEGLRRAYVGMVSRAILAGSVDAANSVSWSAVRPSRAARRMAMSTRVSSRAHVRDRSM